MTFISEPDKAARNRTSSFEDKVILMGKRSLAELAEYVGAAIKGNPEIQISAGATLEKAGPGEISFLANRKYVNQLQTTRASAVVIDNDSVDCAAAALLVAEDPYYAFTRIITLLYGHRKHPGTGISEKASVHESAQIGENSVVHAYVTVSEQAHIGDNCVLYPGVFIGPGTRIGDDCILYPNVAIYERCTIGDRVIIQANSTVGEDGFGFATHNGEHHKIPHVGTVIIEQDVEIGSNCAIERGTLDDTTIGKGTKIGDSVVIGHGTKVGSHCLLVAQVGVAGSTVLGHHCVVGGQAGIVGHINIGDMVKIGAQAAVINDVPDGKVIVGAPAIEAGKARRAYSLIEYLPQMRKSLRHFEKRLRNLEDQTNG